MRRARAERTTSETTVTVDLVLDGTGDVSIDTGVPFFDHMLDQLGRHSGFDLTIAARGDVEIDDHHTVEDVGLALGDCFKEALGAKEGIARYGWAIVPMEEALCRVSLDLSGRPYLSYDVPVAAERVGEFEPHLIAEFLRALTNRAGITLHITQLDGSDPHHILESVFKALAQALAQACAASGRQGPPSTKGVLE